MIYDNYINLEFTTKENNWIIKKKLYNIAKLILKTFPKSLKTYHDCSEMYPKNDSSIVNVLPILSKDIIYFKQTQFIAKNAMKHYRLKLSKYPLLEFYSLFYININKLKSVSKFFLFFGKYSVVQDNHTKSLKIQFQKIILKHETYKTELIYSSNRLENIMIINIIIKLSKWLKHNTTSDFFEQFQKIHQCNSSSLLAEYISNFKILLFFHQVVTFHNTLYDNSIREEKIDVFYNLTLPFKPTVSQRICANQILHHIPNINVVLHGDVGSGKTLVLGGVINQLLNNNKKIFYLVPTKILAKQIINTLSSWSIPVFDIEENKKHSNMLKPNNFISIGTIKIFWEQYRHYDTFIIDEEHKFGLRHKEFNIKNKNILLVSATLIPGTLEKINKSFYKLINLEHTKQHINTWYEIFDWDKLYTYIKPNEKALIILPFIESGIITMEQIVSYLKQYYSNIAILHGKLKSEEQQNIINYFKSHGHILISTSIAENGINIPNLNNVIIIYPEYFGIAQLYQIRGRVDRENQGKGKCFLLYNSKANINSIERIQHFAKIQKGIWLSYIDYFMRGGGILENSQKGYKIGILNPQELNKLIEMIQEKYIYNIKVTHQIYDHVIYPNGTKIF